MCGEQADNFGIRRQAGVDFINRGNGNGTMGIQQIAPTVPVSR